MPKKTTVDSEFLLHLIVHFFRFCPKHRDQQAIERAKVKQQITSNNMEASLPAVSGKISAPKHPANDKQIHESVESPKGLTTYARNKKLIPLTKGRSKTTSTPAPAASLGSKYSRRDTPSVYARPSVNDEELHGQSSPKSPKMARKSKNNEASAEVMHVLKEYRSECNNCFI